MFKKVKADDEIAQMLQIINNNCDEAKTIREAIKKLEAPTSIQESTPVAAKLTITPVILNKDSIETDYIEDPDNNNDELNSIISEYIKMVEPTPEELLCILPEIDSNDFSSVIYRLIIESRKEIIEMTKLKVETKKTSDASDISEINNLIENEKRKIRLLEVLLNEEKEQEEQEEEKKNNIILAPNQSGGIFIFDDLDKIPFDFYGDIYDAIQAIIENKSKNETKSKNKKILKTRSYVSGGFRQKRTNDIRVVYRRLNKDTYAILYILIKKDYTSSIYLERLIKRLKDYKQVEHNIKANLNNPEFLDANAQSMEELWSKLGKNKLVAKKMKKDRIS